MSLSQARHWVFDMDGTLTVAVHDFVAIRQALDIPATEDILQHLAALPVAEAARKRAWLHAHEHELARTARPATGAHELLDTLRQRGCRLGILTRNAHDLALLTLSTLGMAEFFDASDILGRDEAAPKPDPEGLLKLAEGWDVAPEALVMVGDYRFDLACARAAGARSVLVNSPDNPWPELTDHHAADCAVLRASLGS